MVFSSFVLSPLGCRRVSDRCASFFLPLSVLKFIISRFWSLIWFEVFHSIGEGGERALMDR